MGNISFARRGQKPLPGKTEYLVSEYDLHPVIASVLASRIGDGDADAFLNPGIVNMNKSDAFADMAKAVRIIKAAVSEGKQIYICGDYDTDGICGTTIIYRTIKSQTEKVKVAIPERDREGYGISRKVVDELISTGGGLIITVDCGISENETLSYAKENGISVIITDHHTCPTELPPADAIINPKRPGETYPDKNLCGAGVAFKLACALIKNDAFEFIDLAAIATIADMVEMTGENRIIASKGLYKINVEPDPAIRALLYETNLLGRQIDSEKISFIVAPRINAAGRVGKAETAFRLFRGDDHSNPAMLRKYSRSLCEMNRDRQELQQKIIDEISPLIEQGSDNANILCGSDWPVGVIGLAASWGVQKTCRPTVLLTQKDGILTGSARSIEGIDIFEILRRCEKYLVKYGGHSQAAGLSVDPGGFDEFRHAFLDIINDPVKYPKTAFVKKHYYDECCEVSDIDEKFFDDMQRLAPFGVGNPSLRILFRDVEIQDRNSFCNGQHSRFSVCQKKSRIGAVMFNKNASDIPPRCDIVAGVSKNDYTNKTELVCEAVI